MPADSTTTMTILVSTQEDLAAQLPPVISPTVPSSLMPLIGPSLKEEVTDLLLISSWIS